MASVGNYNFGNHSWYQNSQGTKVLVQYFIKNMYINIFSLSLSLYFSLLFPLSPSPSVILSFASLLIFDHKRWSCQNNEIWLNFCLIKVEPKLWNPVNLCQNRKIVKSSQSHKILPMNWKIWLLVSSHLCKQIGGYLLFAINHQGYKLYSVGAAWAAEKISSFNWG